MNLVQNVSSCREVLPCAYDRPRILSSEIKFVSYRSCVEPWRQVTQQRLQNKVFWRCSVTTKVWRTQERRDLVVRGSTKDCHGGHRRNIFQKRRTGTDFIFPVLLYGILDRSHFKIHVWCMAQIWVEIISKTYEFPRFDTVAWDARVRMRYICCIDVATGVNHVLFVSE